MLHSSTVLLCVTRTHSNRTPDELKVADHFGVDPGTVGYTFRKPGVPRRNTLGHKLHQTITEPPVDQDGRALLIASINFSKRSNVGSDRDASDLVRLRRKYAATMPWLYSLPL